MAKVTWGCGGGLTTTTGTDGLVCCGLGRIGRGAGLSGRGVLLLLYLLGGLVDCEALDASLIAVSMMFSSVQ